MRLSLNQIEQIARKAVRGAGLPWGLAEEAGRAVRWLAMFGLPGMAWLAATLSSVDHDGVEELLIQWNSDGWSGVSGRISPLLAGPSLSDFLGGDQGMDEPSLIMRNLVCPPLCAGYVGITCQRTGRPISLEWTDGAIHIAGSRIWVDGPMDMDPGADMSDLRVSFRFKEALPPGEALTATVESKEVSASVLAMLEPLVDRTYVPNTEISRLSGAGDQSGFHT